MTGEQFIGKYRVERRLGSGSFASVWLAYDPDLDARVAIKVLADNWSQNDDIKRRFIQEARMLWRIDDSRVVRVYTTGELEDGRPYFVMEYADRGTLYTRMVTRFEENRQFSVEEALTISRYVAEALAVIHGMGIVHRDLKPNNILFRSGTASFARESEHLMLADFGIARQLELATGFTITAGTMHYMAPEQANPGTSGQVDHRSDIYAAAVILFELLTGRVPFPYDSQDQILRTQMSEPLPLVHRLRDDVPDFVSAVVSRGMAPNPDDRYSTAQEWAEALDQALEMIAESEAGEATLIDDLQEPQTITSSSTLLDTASNTLPGEQPAAGSVGQGGLGGLSRSRIVIGCAALLLLLTCTSTVGVLAYLGSREDDADAAESTPPVEETSTAMAASGDVGNSGTEPVETPTEDDSSPTTPPSSTPTATSAPPTPTSTPVPPTPTELQEVIQFTPAEQRVMSHFRLVDWGDRCQRNNAPPVLLSAQVVCSLVEVTSAFQEYYTAEGLNQDLETFRQFPGAQSSPWTRNGTNAGTAVEFIDEEGSAVIFWTEDAELMSGLAWREDNDQLALREWWRTDSYHSFSASISR